MTLQISTACLCRSALALTLCVHLGCLDPLVDDEFAPPSSLLLPSGSAVPLASEDPAIHAQIAASDGVDGVIPRLSAFANGQRIWYWDFGATPDAAVPLFALVRRDADGQTVPVEHFNIIGSVPGGTGYSPFWTIFEVEVTDLYEGQLITSVAALDEARATGLVNAPMLTDRVSNCPVVADDVLLEVGGGLPDAAPVNYFYWRGLAVAYYGFGAVAIDADTSVKKTPVYQLSRLGEPPLREVARGVDITGDGDLVDTNDVFELGLGDAGYSAAAPVIRITVAADYQSIDSAMDETMADARGFADLFNPGPLPRVIAIEETGELRNLPQQGTP